MKNTIRILGALCVLVLPACEMDPFLFNTKTLDTYQLPGNTIPERLIEEVSFESDGHTLAGIYVQSDGSPTDLTLLYCHGNKYHIDEYWNRVMLLHQLQVNVLIFDYRGYGKSEGSPTEDGLFADGEAALDYLLSEKEVITENLILYGYSLGNAASIYLTSRKINPLCLIAESPFASSTSLVQSGTGLDLPHRWLTTGEYNNAQHIKSIHTSFLLFHGLADDFIRYRDNGKVVYENAPDPKKQVLAADAGHKDIHEKLGEENYLKIIREWIVQSKTAK